MRNIEWASFEYGHCFVGFSAHVSPGRIGITLLSVYQDFVH